MAKAEKTEKVVRDQPVEEKITPPIFTRHNHYQGPRFSAGAILLIFVRVVLLLNNLGLLPWEVWANLWRFWPLFLILAGLNIILGKNYFSNAIITLITVILLGLLLLLTTASYNTQVSTWVKENLPFLQNQNLSIVPNLGEDKTATYTISTSQFPNLTERSLNIKLGSSQFKVTDNDDQNNYLVINSHYREGVGVPKIASSSAGSRLDINFETENTTNPMAFFTNNYYNFNLSHPEVTTDLSANLGSGSGSFSLDKTTIRDLKLELGSGSIQGTFATESTPKGQVSVHIGSGSLNLKFGSNVVFSVKYHVGSGELRIENTTLRGEGNYTSANYQDNPNKVNITVDQGSGSVQITKS